LVPIKILTEFRYAILIGFQQYANLVRQVGANTQIYSCALRGTGDYLFVGMYFKQYIEKNNIHDWVFTYTTKKHDGSSFGAPKKIMKLFPYFDGHSIDIMAKNSMSLRRMKAFTGERVHYCNLQYNAQINSIAAMPWPWDPHKGCLMGYRNLTLIDFYLLELGLPLDAKKTSPAFKTISEPVFGSGGNYKTILLSPYSESYIGYAPSNYFWERIATDLKSRGYTVFTNVSGTERAVKSTQPYLVPYAEIVDFLDKSDGFIGLRSGLCDFASFSRCKKIIVYPYGASNWPNGNSLGFTGLKNMGLCEDAIEIECDGINTDAVVKEILSNFPA
jgi:hypothetical protein